MLAGEMALNYTFLAEQSSEHYTVTPIDAIKPDLYQMIEQGYIGLSAFQSFLDWLRYRYGTENIPEVSGLHETLVFLLHWLKVYEEEKGGQA
jgi:hypothetical protein